jgi:hypothetical protein
VIEKPHRSPLERVKGAVPLRQMLWTILIMTFRITRVHANFKQTQLFDLVAGVERFPQFLPWVIAAKVIRRKDAIIWTDLTMGSGRRAGTWPLVRRRIGTGVSYA